MSASRSPPRSGETGSPPTQVVTDCILCVSGTAELLLRPPTRECKHPPDVCLQCLQEAILKSSKEGHDMACPSKNCSRRMSRMDAQLWMTPTKPEQHVVPYWSGYGKATHSRMRRDNMMLSRDRLETDSRPHSLEPGRAVRRDGGDATHISVDPFLALSREPAGVENNNTAICHGGRHQGLHEHLTCDEWDRRQQNPTRQHDQVAPESAQARTMAYPVSGHGGQIRNVESYRPRFCDNCRVRLHTIQLDNSKYHEGCQYYGGTLHNTAPLETTFNGANGYRSGPVARMNYVYPPALLPALYFGQNTMLQNGNAGYNGEFNGLAGAYASRPAETYGLPALAPSSPRQRSDQYAEPSSSSSRTGGAPRPGLIPSPHGRSEIPQIVSPVPTNSLTGSPMDWQPSL